MSKRRKLEEEAQEAEDATYFEGIDDEEVGDVEGAKRSSGEEVNEQDQEDDVDSMLEGFDSDDEQDTKLWTKIIANNSNHPLHAPSVLKHPPQAPT